MTFRPCRLTNRLRKFVILCMTLVSLTSCCKNINGSFCLLYEPVYLDLEHDTPQTIQQVNYNNILYDSCYKD